jgi:hypothetical protein
MGVLFTVGYSGSRYGMTTPQARGIYEYLSYTLATHDWDEPLIEGHHGDCRGGDVQFDTIVIVLGGRRVAHPPANESLRAFCKADVILPAKDYLARDWDIARDTAELVAAPQFPEPVRESGSWTTIGYAVQLGRPVRVFLPEGGWRPGSAFFGAPLPAVPGGVS